MDELDRLQAWYATQCDGDWEHEYEIHIGNLDNPGWTVTIPLSGTELESVPFAEVKDMAPQRDWLRCWVEGGEWHGVGGPLMLRRLLRHFLEWAASIQPATT